MFGAEVRTGSGGCRVLKATIRTLAFVLRNMGNYLMVFSEMRTNIIYICRILL